MDYNRIGKCINSETHFAVGDQLCFGATGMDQDVI